MLNKVIDEISLIILGKKNTIKLALSCLLAKGHLLIEDTPGLGKTTLAYTLAKVLGLNYRRIQFTSDLLPSDILGVSIYNKDTNEFKLHLGPIFANMILADEINRATPKAQSALLEAMAENQVTIEGKTVKLPNPFFVIATQNPIEQIGTFQLPESQLDRFLMCIKIDYPDKSAERELLKSIDRKKLLDKTVSILDPKELIKIQDKIDSIHISDALLDYMQNLLEFSRISGKYIYGLSPRAGLGLLRAAKAWALLHAKSYVLPEDVQAVLPSVVGHRLQFIDHKEHQETLDEAQYLIQNVPIP